MEKKREKWWWINCINVRETRRQKRGFGHSWQANRLFFRVLMLHSRQFTLQKLSQWSSFFLLLLSSILTLYLLQMHLKFFVLFIRGLYCDCELELERANGFNRNDKCKNHKKRFATGLRARILSCKWLSIDWKDDVRIVGSSPCSKLAPVLASFSADLASELRKLVAIKVGCKWPLKVYVAREKNHFL